MRPTKTAHSFQVLGEQVKFSSNFDSGNLRAVLQTGPFSFLIESSHDSYQQATSTKSFFHFRVQNYPQNKIIKIVVTNLSLLQCIKPERRSEYRPCYSYNGKEYNRLPDENSKIVQTQKGLTLQIDFVLPKKTNVFFSFALPYSYERYLNMVRDLPQSNQQFYINKQVLCYSKNLLLVYMITITSYDRKTDGFDQIGCSTNGIILPQKHLNQARVYFEKPVILLSARVHPGETPSSWAIQGIIKFLIGPSSQAKKLRNNFQIVIVPMLNPDGVYEGMYRLDTQGHNLNRYYLISDNRQPSIYSMKHLIKHYNATKRLLFYFDFHGHPSFKGSFLYGNAIDDIAYQAETQLFGRIMSIKCDTFQEKYCIFDREQMNSKDKYDMYTKQGCARVYAFKTAKILHSYTVEMGFHGCTNNQKKGPNFHYSAEDYYDEGVSVMLSVLQTCGLNETVDKSKLRRQIADEILGREQRFRKQDKHINMKKKNVNEVIEKYWAPIRSKYFINAISLIPKMKKFKDFKQAKKKKTINLTVEEIETRTQSLRNEHRNYISNVSAKKSGSKEKPKSKQKSSSKQKKVQKQKTDSSQTKVVRKNYFNKRKVKIQIGKSGISPFKNRKMQSQKFQNSMSHFEIEKRMSIEKNSEKYTGSQIKILSQRIQTNSQSRFFKKKAQSFQQHMFNDVNIRKSSYEFQNPNEQKDKKGNYCVLSAQQVSQRVDQLKDIFRADQITKNIFTSKTGKIYKKYSSFFG